MALLSGFTVTDFLYTFVACLLVTLALFKWLRERNYPPGPMGVPLLGYGLFLGKKPNEKLRDLSKKYGDMFSIYLGTDLFVIINEYNIFRDLMSKSELLFRNPKSFDFVIGSGGFAGMNGEKWQEQRRFTFYTMRNLGLGKGQWESLIKENIIDLVEEMKSWQGKPTVIEDTLTISQSNTNISLLFGRHLDEKEDAEVLKILRNSTRELMSYFSTTAANVTIWWMRKFMETFNIGGYERFLVLLRQFENIFVQV